MYEHGYWEGCIEATELTIEGNRQIAQETVSGVRNLWQLIRRTLPEWLIADVRRTIMRIRKAPLEDKLCAVISLLSIACAVKVLAG